MLLRVGATLPVELGLGSCGVGLEAPRQVTSSQTRGETCIPCIPWQILNHWTTRVALELTIFHKNPIVGHSVVIKVVVLNRPLPCSLGTVGVS